MDNVKRKRNGGREKKPAPFSLSSGFFSRVSSFFLSLFPVFVFFALLCNLYVVFRFESTRHPEVHYYVATNAVASSAGPSAAVPNLPRVDPLSSTNTARNVVMTTRYHYFLFDGMRCVKMFDRLYGEGSLTSYGRISVIFPDCIRLENGSYIVNSLWSSAGRDSSAAETEKTIGDHPHD